MKTFAIATLTVIAAAAASPAFAATSCLMHAYWIGR